MGSATSMQSRARRAANPAGAIAAPPKRSASSARMSISMSSARVQKTPSKAWASLEESDEADPKKRSVTRRSSSRLRPLDGSWASAIRS